MTARGRDIEIVVSELLTNALLHARPPVPRGRPGWPVRLGLLRSGPCVLSAVADPSPDPPVPKDPGGLGETGRGLRIVAALSDRWGYCVHTGPGDQEKFVWALFLRDR
jgi:anti-sigma regulatory factor (Ser/Thr protein kinase)